MEPYEKLFSPNRALRQSTRLREKYRHEEVKKETSKKFKEERGSEGEGAEDEKGIEGGEFFFLSACSVRDMERGKKRERERE